MPLARDRRGRLLAPVHINGRGPFNFVFDTGAGLSMISSFLAGQLRLKPAPDAKLLVQGSLGQLVSTRVAAERLTVDDLVATTPLLGVLDEAQLDGADGLLGVDVLQAQCMDLRLRAGELVFFPADSGAARSMDITGAVRVSADRHLDSLLALRASIGGIALSAILDTGAQRSVGNLALQRALGLQPPGTAESVSVLTGVDGSNARADVLVTPSLRLGGARLPPAPILYADLPVFERSGFARRPALLLGMDLLGQLGRVFVDFRRTRVLVWA